MILIVEDNPNDEALTLRALGKLDHGCEVVVVRDGAEALDFLSATGRHAERDPSSLPTVILLDLNLPKIDGLEVLRRIRADDGTRTVPVVVLTSSDEQNDVIEAYRAGANSYIRKSIAFAEFSEAVQQLGRYWLQLNVTPPRGR
jgi:two-component system response regulator